MTDLPKEQFHYVYLASKSPRRRSILKKMGVRFELIVFSKATGVDLDENPLKDENINNIYKEFYKRLVIPLYIPLLTLVPFLLIFSSKESTNYNKLKIITFIIGFICIIFSETTIRFISEILFNNLFFSLIPILAVLILYLFFLTRFNTKKISQ